MNQAQGISPKARSAEAPAAITIGYAGKPTLRKVGAHGDVPGSPNEELQEHHR